MMRRPIDPTAARELAERAGLIVLDPDSPADHGRLSEATGLDSYDAADAMHELARVTDRPRRR
jgi:hypothetical protein